VPDDSLLPILKLNYAIFPAHLISSPFSFPPFAQFGFPPPPFSKSFLLMDAVSIATISPYPSFPGCMTESSSCPRRTVMLPPSFTFSIPSQPAFFPLSNLLFPICIDFWSITESGLTLHDGSPLLRGSESLSSSFAQRLTLDPGPPFF